MSLPDEIAAVPAGARFYRADLHIHSYGGSHDVTDSAMTPEGIIATAVREHLAIIAITDHNEIKNVRAALESAASKPILVIPGVELSTPEGHLLVYFQRLEELAAYYGKLAFAARGTPDSRCQTSILECLRLVDPNNGFAILAHVDGPGGTEEKIPGYPPHKGDILASRSLLGIELLSASSPISYSPTDPDPQRASFGQTRITRLGLGQKQFLARVVFSDTHTLSALGKNAQGNRRMTRIKMDCPSFQGVRLALEDSDARIRLEDEIPSSVPYLMGVKLEGGFLDGQIIHLSRNLNCIIGGRGAGKSTAFEAIRCASNQPSPSKLVDSEIWPDMLDFVWVDEAGQQHLVARPINEQAENIGDPVLGLTSFPVEAYGQNEAAQTSVRAQTDPGALLGYLDQFIDFGSLKDEDESLRNQLLENQSQIEKAHLQVARIPDLKKFLAMSQQQLQAIEKLKATEVVALERKVAEERTLRTNIDRKISEIGSNVKESAALVTISELRELTPKEPLKVGAAEYRHITTIIEEFEVKIKAAQDSIGSTAKEVASKIKSQLEQWKTKEKTIVEQIEAKRKELAAQGVKLDIAHIRKLAADEAQYKKDLITLQAWEKHLVDLKKQRANLLTQRGTVRSKIATMRVGFSKKASTSLQGALGDLTVSVKFSEGALSPQAQDIIQRAMNWRTTQVPRAALIVEQVTVPRLLDSVRRTDPTSLMNMQTPDSTKMFNKMDALEIVKALSQVPFIFELERCEFDDLPRITVTRTVIDPEKPPRYLTRDFGRLSLGQQQSVLLSLMLLSESSYPLIIDQPEDNLDGEFIYHSLVPVLRRAKERRQVIVVTHNANIAVLGDAEQIIALKSTSDKSSIVARGSIDDQTTKEFVCQILEGSAEAFRRRARVYGITS